MAHPEGEAAEIVTGGPIGVSEAADRISLFDDEVVDGKPIDEEGYELEPAAEEAEGEDEPAEAQSEELEGGEVEPEEPAIEPPTSWDSDAKARFRELPPELQAVVTQRESERDKGLQQKAQEAAEARKQSEEALQRIEQERQFYVQQLQAMAPPLPDRPDQTLLDTDPIEYMRQERLYSDAIAQRQQVQAEIQRTNEVSQQQHQAQQAEFLAKNNAQLSEKLPEWSSDDAPQFKKQLTSYAMEFGYDAQRLSMADAMDIQVLAKAMKYDELQKSKPAAKEALKAKPKVQRPGVKAPKGQAQLNRITAKHKQLKKSGSAQDAALLIEELLD